MASRRRHVASKPEKTTQRVNLQIDAEAYQRLLLHGIMGKEQPGTIVSRLIDQHLRDWRVQRNQSARAMSSDSATSDDHASESEPMAA
jgi:hypothetical protein